MQSVTGCSTYLQQCVMQGIATPQPLMPLPPLCTPSLGPPPPLPPLSSPLLPSPMDTPALVLHSHAQCFATSNPNAASSTSDASAPAPPSPQPLPPPSPPSPHTHPCTDSAPSCTVLRHLQPLTPLHPLCSPPLPPLTPPPLFPSLPPALILHRWAQCIPTHTSNALAPPPFPPPPPPTHQKTHLH